MGKVVQEKLLSPDWRKRVQIEYTRLKQQKKFRHQVMRLWGGGRGGGFNHQKAVFFFHPLTIFLPHIAASKT